MSSININQLKSLMVSAAKQELSEDWPEVKLYAESEAKKIAETVKMLAALSAAGKISKSAAKLHLRIQKNAARTVLLAVEGLTLLTVESAINAAIRAIKKVVNEGIGFSLI